MQTNTTTSRNIRRCVLHLPWSISPADKRTKHDRIFKTGNWNDRPLTKQISGENQSRGKKRRDLGFRSCHRRIELTSPTLLQLLNQIKPSIKLTSIRTGIHSWTLQSAHFTAADLTRGNKGAEELAISPSSSLGVGAASQQQLWNIKPLCGSCMHEPGPWEPELIAFGHCGPVVLRWALGRIKNYSCGPHVPNGLWLVKELQSCIGSAYRTFYWSYSSNRPI